MGIGNKDSFGFNHNINIPQLEASGLIIMGNQVNVGVSYSSNVIQGGQVNAGATVLSSSFVGGLVEDSLLRTTRINKDELVRFGFRNPSSLLAGFQPPQITVRKTTAWFDPRNFGHNTLWLDASNYDSVILDGVNRVSEWKDKSGRGKHHSQSTPSRRPYYTTRINGLRTITLVAANLTHLDFTDSTGTLMPYFNPPYTILVVTRQRGTGTIFGQSNTFGTSRYQYMGITDTDADTKREFFFDMYTPGNLYTRVYGPDYVDNSLAVVVVRVNSLSSRNIRVNGVQTNNTATEGLMTAAETIDKSSIGAFFRFDFSTGVSFAEGDVSEIIVLTDLIDDTTIEYMEDKLAKKWGILF